MFLPSTSFDVDLDSLDEKIIWLDTFKRRIIGSSKLSPSSMLLNALTVSYKCPFCDTDFTKQANWIQHTCVQRKNVGGVNDQAKINATKSNVKGTDDVEVIAVIERPTASQDAAIQPQNSDSPEIIFENELINDDAIDNELQKYIEV